MHLDLCFFRHWYIMAMTQRENQGKTQSPLNTDEPNRDCNYKAITPQKLKFLLKRTKHILPDQENKQEETSMFFLKLRFFSIFCPVMLQLRVS